MGLRSLRSIIVDATFASSVRCAPTNTKPRLRVTDDALEFARITVAM